MSFLFLTYLVSLKPVIGNNKVEVINELSIYLFIVTISILNGGQADESGNRIVGFCMIAIISLNVIFNLGLMLKSQITDILTSILNYLREFRENKR